MRSFGITTMLSAAMLLTPFAISAEPSPADTAKQLLTSSGVQGGLVVHVQCGDGRLTTALRDSDSYLVHGLATDAQMLAEARQTVQTEGVYGPVCIDQLTGNRLPYVDNSVNLLILHDREAVAPDEVLRVLAPRGVALTAIGSAPPPGSKRNSTMIDGTAWIKMVKPVPGIIDEWTHYMHDASNNAVAHDTAIGPLRHLQWDGAPRYSRHHEFTSSVAAMVSAQGRLFSIMDMGSRASIHLPAKWRLTARDAFNGIVLWEREIQSWFNHLWPLKDGPAQPPRRLVAVGDSVFVTLGLDAPVTRLDAATGKIISTYEGTEFTEEILCSNGTLILLKNNESMNPKEYYPKLMICWDEKKRTLESEEGLLLTPQPRHVLAIDVESGTTHWQVDRPVEPLTLTADNDNVYFHDWTRVVCLDRRSGQLKWESEPVVPRENMGYVYGPTLVAYEDVILFADGRKQRKIFALSKTDGKVLWQAPHYPAGHAGSPEDLFVIDGLVWCGRIAGGRDSGVFTGRDPMTGEVVREFTPDVDTYWFHHRCYRSKATDKFILTSRTGIEFVDVRKQSWDVHHWVRGACSYGILPCNGLIYAPPHPCACYLESKLSGLCALAAPTQRSRQETLTPDERLVRGDAYDPQPGLESGDAVDWPTYRHDASRSGATNAKVPETIAERWSTKLTGRLTAPVVSAGHVFVASQDTHTVHALNARTGQPAWAFTAGARIDSPPTVYGQFVLFGSADGHVYCLRAADGALVWKFSAAPRDMRLVSYGRLESVWPVHGSLLVQDGDVYCVAGRSTLLDGGLRFYRLNAMTGELLSEKVLHDQQNPQVDVNVLNMPTALTDILSSDGKWIYMHSQAFDMEGNRIETIDPNCDPTDRATRQLGLGAHLFSPTGFLDDNAWHRSYWIFGRAFSSGCNWWYRAGRYAPAGRMLVFDEERVYGFGREPGLFVWSHVLENHLFCSEKQASESAITGVRKWSDETGRDAIFNRRVTRQTSVDKRLAPKLHWSVQHPPLHVRAMVLAGKTLVVAGPPDVLDEDAAFTRPFAPGIQANKFAQDAAISGKLGAVLMTVSTADGETINQLELDSPPVWDGMAVTSDGIYLVTVDGRVTCMRAP